MAASMIHCLLNFNISNIHIIIIALVSMISGLLSFVLPFIFDFVARLISPIDFLVLSSGPVAALVGVALGILSLLLGAYDPKTFRLAVIGSLTGVVWFIVVLVWILFGGLKGILPGPC
jgi:hypothetical protein